MKTISQALKEHLSQSVVTLAYCWKLELLDGLIKGFTGCDRDLLIDGVTYQAKSGFTADEMHSKPSMIAGNMQIEGILESDGITAVDLTSGRYDGAKITVFIVNYQDLSQGHVVLHNGKLGKVTTSNNVFNVEIVGLSSVFNNNLGDLYSPLCRAQFCDEQCKLNKTDFKKPGTVTIVTDNRRFIDENLRESDNYYRYGYVKFFSGLNDGQVFEIKEYQNNQIELFMATPHTIKAGDRFEIIAGCDKTFNVCASQFNNTINFRGEPHLPGSNNLMPNAQ